MFAHYSYSAIRGRNARCVKRTHFDAQIFSQILDHKMLQRIVCAA